MIVILYPLQNQNIMTFRDVTVMEIISPYVLLAVTMAACLFAYLLKNLYSKKYQKKASDPYMFSAVTSVISAATVAAVSGGIGSVSKTTLIFALVYGIDCAVQTVALALALQTGPLSYSSVIVSLSTVIPAFSGWVFWNEKMTVLRLVGILLMIACFVFSAKKEEEGKKAQKQWYIYAALSFLTTGLCGVIQKMYGQTAVSGETAGFVVTAFAFSTLVSLIMFAVFKLKERKIAHNGHDRDETVKKAKIDFIIPAAVLVATGICVGLNNQINLYLAGIMDSAFFFPVVNGGNLLLVTLFSVTVFGERPSLRQWIGLALGCASVVMLCL